MSGTGQQQSVTTDRVLLFTVPQRHARGRVTRLGPLVDTILSAHAYPPLIRHLLAEALLLTTMLGSLLKDGEGQLTMQAQGNGGAINLLVCDYRGNELRGYADFDEAAVAGLGGNASLPALFGQGYLAITYDMASSGERYQGIVALEEDTLSAACEEYFARSEQVPTVLRTAIRTEGDRTLAGGLLVQHFPEGEEGRERLSVKDDWPEWEHVSILAGSIRHEELVDTDLSPEEIVWRLFHEEAEVRVIEGPALVRGCRCTAEHYEDLLSRFSEEDRAEMRNEAGEIVVDCAFCSREFALRL